MTHELGQFDDWYVSYLILSTPSYLIHSNNFLIRQFHIISCNILGVDCARKQYFLYSQLDL